jgi:hypothetical protein
MEIRKAAKAKLADLDRCDGHIMYDVVDRRANQYDGNPAAGSPRGSQPVEMEVFEYLRSNELIEKTGGRETLRYRISKAGKASLSAAVQR